jgi:dTDP-4-dehydrorhamnose 3,5-epimerase
MPAHCAHGLQTLVDDTEVFYQMSAPYVAHAARGVRWDDATLNINWPLEVTALSDRDRNWPALAAQSAGCAVPAA